MDNKTKLCDGYVIKSGLGCGYYEQIRRRTIQDLMRITRNNIVELEWKINEDYNKNHNEELLMKNIRNYNEISKFRYLLDKNTDSITPQYLFENELIKKLEKYEKN